MRTSINTTFTNRNVFGTSQDRVVSLCKAYAYAAQHLASWHASERADPEVPSPGHATPASVGPRNLPGPWPGPCRDGQAG